MTWVLGISAHYHDAAAALIRDGALVCAAQEERFTRLKGDARVPEHAAAWCLAEAGIAPKDLAAVVYYEKPWLHLERLLETHLAVAPFGLAQWVRGMPGWLETKLGVARGIRHGVGWDGPVSYVEHHAAHRAAAFYASPFERAAILTVDGVGEWATASIARGAGNRIEVIEEMTFPSSLGLLYAAITAYLGFAVNADEYKVMGLAAYGKPRLADALLADAVDLKEDGSLRLDPAFFSIGSARHFTTSRLHSLLGGPPRAPEAPIDDRHRDVAASAQAITDRAVLAMARRAHQKTGERVLAMGGGVALNSVANGHVAREGPFERVWIQPAAGDAGSALGAALAYWHEKTGAERNADGERDALQGALLGPRFTPREAHAVLDRAGLIYTQLGPEPLAARVAELIAEGRVVGWFPGRMELGPRALGARSILADARREDVKQLLNERVKWREEFRPFAPAVLADRAAELFEIDGASPYMTRVVPVREEARATIPGATHVDGSARVQTVGSDRPLHGVLRAFAEKTGCSAVVNTSFNVRGEPIVCSPEDAVRCFLATEIDVLAIEDALCLKTGQPKAARSVSPRRWPGAPDRGRTRRALRSFGLALAALMLGAAWWASDVLARSVLASTAVLALVCAAIAPAALGGARRALGWAGGLIGLVIRPLVLTLVYLAVVTPYGLVRRLFRSPVRPPRAASYWRPPEAHRRGQERWNQPF